MTRRPATARSGTERRRCANLGFRTISDLLEAGVVSVQRVLGAGAGLPPGHNCTRNHLVAYGRRIGMREGTFIDVHDSNRLKAHLLQCKLTSLASFRAMSTATRKRVLSQRDWSDAAGVAYGTSDFERAICERMGWDWVPPISPMTPARARGLFAARKRPIRSASEFMQLTAHEVLSVLSRRDVRALLSCDPVGDLSTAHRTALCRLLFHELPESVDYAHPDAWIELLQSAKITTGRGLRKIGVKGLLQLLSGRTAPVWTALRIKTPCRYPSPAHLENLIQFIGLDPGWMIGDPERMRRDCIAAGYPTHEALVAMPTHKWQRFTKRFEIRRLLRGFGIHKAISLDARRHIANIAVLPHVDVRPSVLNALSACSITCGKELYEAVAMQQTQFRKIHKRSRHQRALKNIDLGPIRALINNRTMMRLDMESGLALSRSIGWDDFFDGTWYDARGGIIRANLIASMDAVQVRSAWQLRRMINRLRTARNDDIAKFRLKLARHRSFTGIHGRVTREDELAYLCDMAGWDSGDASFSRAAVAISELSAMGIRGNTDLQQLSKHNYSRYISKYDLSEALGRPINNITSKVLVEFSGFVGFTNTCRTAPSHEARNVDVSPKRDTTDWPRYARALPAPSRSTARIEKSVEFIAWCMLASGQPTLFDCRASRTTAADFVAHYGSEKEICFEVKSCSCHDRTIRITRQQWEKARRLGVRYQLIIVRHNNGRLLEYATIIDPVKVLAPHMHLASDTTDFTHNITAWRDWHTIPSWAHRALQRAILSESIYDVTFDYSPATTGAAFDSTVRMGSSSPSDRGRQRGP